MPRVAQIAGPARATTDSLEAAAREAGYEALLREGAEVERFALAPRGGPPRPGIAVRHRFSWTAARALRKALSSNGPFELIHAEDADAARLARRARPDLPLVISCDGAGLLAGERPPVLAEAQVAVAPSTGVAQLARQAGAKSVLTDPPGVDASDRRRGPWPDPPRLVTAAPLVARARHGDVLRAIAVLAPRYPELRYVVIGDGPERGRLGELAARLGVEQRVQWTGPLDAPATRAQLDGATILAMPSIEEPFGVSYIEAMVAGVPAIGCRGEPGPEEIAAAGDGLTLVPPGDIERLSQRIDELLGDAARLREAGLRARATAALHFTLEQHAARLLAAYRQALAP